MHVYWFKRLEVEMRGGERRQRGCIVILKMAKKRRSESESERASEREREREPINIYEDCTLRARTKERRG